MQSGPQSAIATPMAMKATEPPRHAPRLRLKPEAPTTGYVDGAWWPRSRDLSAELPALLAALTGRLARIERITYDLAAWAPTRRRLVLDDYVVQLEGFRSQRTDTVTVVGESGRQRLTLLVVPPETNPGNAQQILLTASHSDNIDDIETLLTRHTTPEPADTATQRWELDGGRIPISA